MVLTTLRPNLPDHCAPGFFSGSCGSSSGSRKAFTPSPVGGRPGGRTGPEGSSTPDLRPNKALVPKVVATSRPPDALGSPTGGPKLEGTNVRVGASNTSQRESAVAGGHPAVRHAVESILLEERTRWAMQIHDGLTQSVTSAVLELQTLRHLIETDPGAAVRILHEIEVEIRDDLRHIRELLFEMTEEENTPGGPTLAGLIK